MSKVMYFLEKNGGFNTILCLMVCSLKIILGQKKIQNDNHYILKLYVGVVVAWQPRDSNQNQTVHPDRGPVLGKRRRAPYWRMRTDKAR